MQDYGKGRISIAYLPEDRKTLLTDRVGNKLEYIFDEQGTLVEKSILTKDGRKITTSYEHNKDTERTRIVLPSGRVIEYIYDSAAKDPRARGNALIYRLISSRPGDSPIEVRFQYEKRFQRVKRIIDERGNETVFYYDYEEKTLGDLNGDNIITPYEHGNIVRMEHPSITLPDKTKKHVIEKFGWDEKGQLSWYVDERGLKTVFEYDPATAEVSAITLDPEGLCVRREFVYDKLGNIDYFCDANGNTCYFEHNALGWIVEFVPPVPYSDGVIKIFYDANGNAVRLENNICKVKDGISSSIGTAIVELQYDILNNLIERREKISADEWAVTRWVLDAEENIEEVIYPEGNREKIERDERFLATRRIFGYGTDEEVILSLKYGDEGELVWIERGSGRIRIIEEILYDGFGRIKGFKDGEGNTTLLKLDTLGNVVEEKVLSPDGKIARWKKFEYDEDNNLRREAFLIADPRTGKSVDELVTLYFRDESGLVTKIINPENEETVFERDVIGSVIRRSEADGSYTLFGYDKEGSVSSVTKFEIDQKDGKLKKIVRSYRRDSLGEVIAEILPDGKRIEYTRDSLGRLIELRDGSGRVLRFVRDLRGLPVEIFWEKDGEVVAKIKRQWDKNGLQKSLEDGNGNVTVFEYTASGLLKKRIFPDGSFEEMLYNNAGLATTVNKS
mgnify:CR=1 FL=1